MSNWVKTGLVFVVIAAIMGFFKFNNYDSPLVLEDKNWDSDFFIQQASPLATVEQLKEQDKFLPVVTEAERFDHPKNTEIQLRRARWSHMVTKKPKTDPSKPQRHVSAEEAKKYEWKPFVMADLADVSQQSDKVVQVLVGDTDTPIPALSSGKLPIFTDAEKARYMPDLLSQGLDELDFRRAAWWLKNHNADPIPPMPEDLDVRKQEEEAKNITDEEAREPAAFQRRYDAIHRPAPLTANERLTMAGNVLLKLNLQPSK